MERETKSIDLKESGKVAVLKSYITPREVAQMTAESDGKNDLEKTYTMLRMCLISLDSVAENPLEKLLDLPMKDYLQVCEYVKEIAGANFQKAK